MSETLDTAIRRAREDARRDRQLERQARVGILRNPNQPPAPPARKAPLMGKWLRLRSSRRPPADLVEQLDSYETLNPQAQHALAVSDRSRPSLVRHDGDQVTGVDISGLMESVQDLAPNEAERTPFAADLEAAQAEIPPLTSAEARAEADLTSLRQSLVSDQQRISEAPATGPGDGKGPLIGLAALLAGVTLLAAALYLI